MMVMIALTVLAYLMVITWKIIAALVILTAPMTVCRIVPAPGVAILSLIRTGRGGGRVVCALTVLVYLMVTAGQVTVDA